MPSAYPSLWRASRLHPTRWLAVLLGGQAWVPRYAPYLVRLDLLLRRVSGGRFTLVTFAGLPELFLTVPGRTTGRLRTTPLVCVPRDDYWLVAGCNWGNARSPHWVADLDAAGVATVGFWGRRTSVAARRLYGEERATAWREMLEVWPNFEVYAARTDREIPVYALEPCV